MVLPHFLPQSMVKVLNSSYVCVCPSQSQIPLGAERMINSFRGHELYIGRYDEDVSADTHASNFQLLNDFKVCSLLWLDPSAHVRRRNAVSSHIKTALFLTCRYLFFFPLMIAVHSSSRHGRNRIGYLG